MKILVVSQYFWPENFRINDLVNGLLELNHEVVVLTGQPNYPSGRFHSGYSFFSPRTEKYGQVEIIRVPLFPRGEGRWFQLALNYFSYVVTACWGVLFRLPRKCKVDAIIVFQPSPITVGIPAALASWRFNAPILFWVLDLWPQSLSAVGAVKSPIVLNMVEALVRWIYKRCTYVLVSSKSFYPEVSSLGVPKQNIRYFPNWGESTDVQQTVKHQIPELPEGFIVMFTGNIGVAQDFPAILDAAAMLKSRKDICWVIVGDGRMTSWAKEQLRIQGLEETVFFLGQFPLDAMPEFFASADVLLLSLKTDPVFSLTVPGKLQSYLASGKPLLAMLDGEAASIISEAHAGLTCPGGDSVSLARAVEKMAAMPSSMLEQMGKNGRLYFDEHFARDQVLGNLQVWLNEVQAPHHRKE